MAAKVNSHNKADSAPVRPAAHPDYKHLLAASHNRVYEDADWDASLAAMQQIQQQNQTLALQQLQSNAGQKLNRNSYASATSDVWHDAFSHTMSDASAVSEAEQKEVEQYLAELEMLRGPAPGRELSCTPTCVPDPPLLFAPKEWKYCQVDPRPFCAYWERDHVRSTPFPLPIDHQMGLGKLALRCHESIPGMWLRVEGNQLLLTATPQIIAIPGVVNYHEYFNVDSTPTTWALRRDISLGRSQGQMFMTTDGILIFRVFNMGVFSKTVDSVFEDYMRVEDNGTVIVTQQWCRHIGDNTSCSQYLIGRKTGPNPPSHKHKH